MHSVSTVWYSFLKLKLGRHSFLLMEKAIACSISKIQENGTIPLIVVG